MAFDDNPRDEEWGQNQEEYDRAMCGSGSHDWRVVPEHDLGGNRDAVQCICCGVPGERDNPTGEVFWPAT
jgi:hypothetical protein